MAFNDANSGLVLVKLQTAEGSPATPSVGSDPNYADEVWCRNRSPIQPNSNFNDDSFASTDHTPQLWSRGRRKNNVRIETKLMSRGDNGGVPWLDALLQACGMGDPGSATTEETSKDVYTYSPVSGTSKLASIWSYEDGWLFKANDCRGTYSLTMNAGQTPDLLFELAGKYVTTTSGIVTPAAVMPVDTKTIVENENLLIGDFSPTWTNFTLTHGNSLEEILDGNSDKAYHSEKIAGRPNARINLTVRARKDGNKDFFDYIESQGTGGVYDDISLTHGDGVQSDIVVTCTDPQLIAEPQKSEANGIRQYQLTYLLREYTLKFREEQ